MGKKKTKVEKNDKTKDIDLFSPVASGEAPSYYVYTNNFNFRHILSMDSVLPLRFFETDIFRPFPGGKIDWGILITKEPLMGEILQQFEDAEEGSLYTIILEYQIEKGVQIPAYIVNTNYEQKLGLLEDLLLPTSTFAIIPGYLPVQAITKIHFRSEQLLKEFITIKSANIEFDEKRCSITPDLFSGQLEIEEGRILELFNSISVPVELYKRQITLRNKIKASLIVSYYSYIQEIEHELRTNFDHTFLDVIAEIKGDISHSSETEIGNILNQIKELKKFDVKKISSLMKLKDNTPFRYLAWTKKLLLDKSLEQNLAGHVQAADEDVEAFSDIISYKILLYLLCEASPDNFNPKLLLQSFLQEFRDRMPHLITEKNLPSFDQVALRYEKAIKNIQSVLDGLGGKIVDLLANWPQNFITLKGLLVFLTAYSPNDYHKLQEKLQKFPLNSFEKRIIWSLYGMLNGMAPLGYEVKKDFQLLKRIDAATAIALNCDYVPRKPYEEAYYQRMPTTVKFSKGKDESIIIVTTNGIEYFINILNSRSLLWNRVKTLLADKNYENNIKELLLNCRESEPYACYRIQATQYRYDKGDIILNSHPQIRKEWGNWNSFKDQYFENQQSFEKLSNESMQSLSDFIKN